jgi:5-methylcytosine-specific restriction protein B
LKGWNNKELERLLYFWADPRDQRKILKIAPGPDAQYWDECRDGGFICVGWDEMGDLRQFESKEAYQKRFNEVFGQHYNQNKSALTKKGNELWTLRELEPGDLVVANKGKSKVLAVGEVVEPGYEWNEERSDYRHIVRVKWDTSVAQDIPTQSSWGFYTVAPVPQNLAAQILGKKDGKTAVPVDALYRDVAEALARKGQVILYGPPGTGKTFMARRFSVWWLLKELGTESSEILSDEEAFAQAEAKLSSAQIVRRVWWIVANPKEWSWDRLFKEKRVVAVHRFADAVL